MVYSTTGFHPFSPSTVINHGDLAFDHERQPPKPMCGKATLTKLGILPSHTKRKQHHFLRKTAKQYQSIPIELTPINTLFVTEQEFLSGQQGTTSLETGSSDSAPLASPDSIDLFRGIPQLHVNTAMVHQDFTEKPISPERPTSVTKTSRNTRFDLSKPEAATEEETDEGDYMVFEDGVEEPPLSPHLPPPMHRENSYIFVSTEVDNDDTNGVMLTLSKDYSSISSKETSCESSDQSTLYEDRVHEEEEMELIAMRDTILRQQDNLQRLEIKNQQYRDRLAASHGRVLSLYKDHFESIEAILTLQFERESFEAEAVLLREQLKEVRNELSNELSKLHKDEHRNNLKNNLHFGMKIAPNKATTELHWTRVHSSILHHQRQTIDHDQQPVEVPLTPYSFKSPSHAKSHVQAPVSYTMDNSEKPGRVPRDVEDVQSSFYTPSPPLACGWLSSWSSPKHHSSFSSQGSSVNTTKDSESSTPTNQRKTIRFHAADKTHVEQIVREQQTNMQRSSATRWSHAKNRELAASTLPISVEDMSNERCEEPQQLLKQNLIRHTLSPAMPVESPSSGVPGGTPSSRRHESVDRRRISDGSNTDEIAAFIGWTSKHRIQTQVSFEEPKRPVSPSNRQLQPCGQYRLNSQFLQNRTKLLRDGADLQTLKDRIWSSNLSLNQPEKCDETQPMTDSLEESESSEEKVWADLSSCPSNSETFPRQPLIPSHATHPKSPVRQRNDDELESLFPPASPPKQISPRSRYLSALTRPFPANSTIMLSKVRTYQGQSAKTATIQPKQRGASNHQPYGKPKAAQPEFLGNQQRMFTPELSGEKFTPVKPERHCTQEQELTSNLSEAGNTIDPPLSSSCGIDGSKVMSYSFFMPLKRSTRALEDYRDLYRAQNQTWADIASIPSNAALGPASPRATHHIPDSCTSDSDLPTHRVRNGEGEDGSFGLKRQYIKVQKQAKAPTMSYAEANAELGWVKSHLRILESMKVNVDAKGSQGNVPLQKGHDNGDLVDLNNIEERNRRVDTVRMQMIKATLEPNEKREGRDDMENDRGDLDDLEVHYGRE
ncbi:hypothetical protein MHU86_8037 [Fragilaria crotonensis]|nr:hypothetical protein MHU86_8037 [Fragilaria crotonensis]